MRFNGLSLHIPAVAPTNGPRNKLVDVEELRSRVRTAVGAVDAELAKVGVSRSGKRSTIDATGKAHAKLRRTVERFFKFLGTLEDDVPVDVSAFFPGGKLGKISSLKPADLKAKADGVVKGFAAPSNSALPEAAAWKARLETDRGALASSLEGKGGSASGAIVATAGLVAARDRFLVLYQGVAKKLILGLLSEHGRKGELRLFFKDLQVGETGSPADHGGDGDEPTEPSVPAVA